MAGAGASPTITRLAGVLGAGPVRSVATATSSGIAPSGFRVYVSDDAEGVIRLVDLARGQTSVVGGDGSNGRNLADGSLATSGAINPGARTVAPDGSVAHSQGVEPHNATLTPTGDEQPFMERPCCRSVDERGDSKEVQMKLRFRMNLPNRESLGADADLARRAVEA